MDQGIHTRSGGEALIEGNVFSDSIEPCSWHLIQIIHHLFIFDILVSTYGFVILADSPVDPEGDYEPDGYANLGVGMSSTLLLLYLITAVADWRVLMITDNDFGDGTNNITETGDFTSVPYKYILTPLEDVQSTVTEQAGVGKV